MQDMKASAEKLRAEADYAEQIARSATAVQKRELYERLAVHFRQLAGEIEKVMADRAESGGPAHDISGRHAPGHSDRAYPEMVYWSWGVIVGRMGAMNGGGILPSSCFFILFQGTTMIDEKVARLRAHNHNIIRYRRLLETDLSDLERGFIEKRLNEERSAVKSLANHPVPGAWD
jgi:hypothetical protein